MTDKTGRSELATAQPLEDDSVGYDPTTEAFHGQFDPDAESSAVVVTVVETVAAVSGSDPTAMPPLYDTVDPEALTALVASARDRPVEISFTYEACRVTVSSDGCVVVEPPTN